MSLTTVRAIAPGFDFGTVNLEDEQYIGRTTQDTEGLTDTGNVFAEDLIATADGFIYPFGQLGAGILVEIQIPQGWSMIASPFPFRQDVKDTFEAALGGSSAVTDKIIIMKNNAGEAYLPEFFFNGIGDFIPGQGYQIKAVEAFTVRLPLLEANEQFNFLPVKNRQRAYHDALMEASIDLTVGWNIIGYNRKTPIDLIEGLQGAGLDIDLESNTIQDVIIMKNYLGQSMLPDFNYNGIGDLLPGQGYQIKTTVAVNNFRWPAEEMIEDALFNLLIE